MTRHLSRLAVLLLALIALGSSGNAADKTALDAPVDMTGVWMPTVIAPDGTRNRAWPADPPFKPDVQAAYETYKVKVKANPEDYDQARDCLPYGMPYQMLLVAQYPMEIVQTKGRLTMIFELHNDVRRVFLDGRPKPTGLSPSFMGYSRGHWEGKTLVIETTDMRDGVLPRPHGPRFKITERITRITSDKGVPMLEDLMTLDDPDTYTEPFTVKTYFRQHPGLELGEYFCSGDLWQQNLSENASSIPWR